MTRGCELVFRELGSETAGRDFGGWDKAGEDTVAWRMEGVMKLVKPATLFLTVSFRVGDGSCLRKATRRSMLVGSGGGSDLSFSLPLFLAVVVKVANSSAGTFLERVAVRASDDLNR